MRHRTLFAAAVGGTFELWRLLHCPVGQLFPISHRLVANPLRLQLIVHAQPVDPNQIQWLKVVEEKEVKEKKERISEEKVDLVFCEESFVGTLLFLVRI